MYIGFTCHKPSFKCVPDFPVLAQPCKGSKTWWSMPTAASPWWTLVWRCRWLPAKSCTIHAGQCPSQPPRWGGLVNLRMVYVKQGNSRSICDQNIRFRLSWSRSLAIQSWWRPPQCEASIVVLGNRNVKTFEHVWRGDLRWKLGGLFVTHKEFTLHTHMHTHTSITTRIVHT